MNDDSDSDVWKKFSQAVRPEWKSARDDSHAPSKAFIDGILAARKTESAQTTTQVPAFIVPFATLCGFCAVLTLAYFFVSVEPSLHARTDLFDPGSLQFP